MPTRYCTKAVSAKLGPTTEPGVLTLESDLIPLLTVGSVETRTEHLGSLMGGTAHLPHSRSDRRMEIETREVAHCEKLEKGLLIEWEVDRGALWHVHVSRDNFFPIDLYSFHGFYAVKSIHSHEDPVAVKDEGT